ncbi:MAG TPA: hypothetical protein H9867_10040 [Candidatus Corynebacterium gallistercoris]|uniref:Secreted protein n=1 Tax=Candidatus Corynebacterium gallistercoris TaxID=2838530 RepID=A0A9D1RYS0_9CORY|nr:hypothetical protein [Candidatus Corynebacterium gallistercoris]
MTHRLRLLSIATASAVALTAIPVAAAQEDGSPSSAGSTAGTAAGEQPIVQTPALSEDQAKEGTVQGSWDDREPDVWDMIWAVLGQVNQRMLGPETAEASQRGSAQTSSDEALKYGVEGSTEAAAVAGIAGSNEALARPILFLAGIAAVVGAIAAGAAALLAR